MKDQRMLQLDGSAGEGGGQILRTALALSLVTGQAFELDRIRARRPKPGLMRQHLTCVQAAATIAGDPAGARLDGAALNSTRLVFRPGAVRAGEYRFQVGSAGSCMLVLQTVLWPLLLVDAPSTLHLSGGTHNPMAPSVSFLQQVLPPLLAQTGGQVTLTLLRHGFYPAGGGEVRVDIVPAAGGLRPFSLMDRGAVLSHHAECLHAGIGRNVASRELDALGQHLNWGTVADNPVQLRDRSLRANEGPGNALMVTLAHEHITEVFVRCGERGVSAEQVASDLAREVRDYLAADAPVGPHLADQLMLPLALAGGGGYRTTQLTLHSQTNARVISQFVPRQLALTRHSAGGWLVTLAADTATP